MSIKKLINHSINQSIGGKPANQSIGQPISQKFNQIQEGREEELVGVVD